LYEEPLHILSGGGTEKFDELSGNRMITSFAFRMEKVTHDVNLFFSKNLSTQIFGYGKGGYKYIAQRIYQDYGDSRFLSPHNGYVLILVEHGVIGLLIFLVFSFGLIIKSYKNNKYKQFEFPVFYIFIMIMIYVIGQNGELTSSLAFLLIGGMIANVSRLD
jgi:hypothetical protein